MEDLGYLQQAGEAEFDIDKDITPPSARLRIPVATLDGEAGQLVLGKVEMLALSAALTAFRKQFPEAFE